MKLIDANHLIDVVLALPNCYNGYSDTYDKSSIIGLIDDQVTVDAVPVVRCKDCRHWRDDNPRVNGYHCCYRMHNIFPMNGSDYCSYGERRTDDAER